MQVERIEDTSIRGGMLLYWALQGAWMAPGRLGRLLVGVVAGDRGTESFEMTLVVLLADWTDNQLLFSTSMVRTRRHKTCELLFPQLYDFQFII